MSYKITSPEEKAYLDRYNLEDYERPSVAADIAAFSVMQEGEQSNVRKLAKKDLKILLIRRAQFPYKGAWALPGGFVLPGEAVEETARRELYEETGVQSPCLQLAGVYAEAGRDPRGWIISNSFIALLNEKDCRLRADTDAWEAAWFRIGMTSEQEGNKGKTTDSFTIRHQLTLHFDSGTSSSNMNSDAQVQLRATVLEQKNRQGNHYSSKFTLQDDGGLAFDHAIIITRSLLELRERVKQDFRLAFGLLSEAFTLAELQNTLEKVKDQVLLSANFRRKIADYVEETGEMTEGEGHRPAKLFRVKQVF